MDHLKAALQKIHAASDRCGCNTREHEAGIGQILQHPEVANFFGIIDRMNRNDPSAAEDGDMQLLRTLCVVKGLHDYAKEFTSCQNPPSSMMDRTGKALDYAIHNIAIK